MSEGENQTGNCERWLFSSKIVKLTDGRVHKLLTKLPNNNGYVTKNILFTSNCGLKSTCIQHATIFHVLTRVAILLLSVFTGVKRSE